MRWTTLNAPNSPRLETDKQGAAMIAPLTTSQKAALAQAVADGGEIILRGADRTEPCPRRDVVLRLVARGFLRSAASPQTGFGIGLHDYYRVTPAGENAINALR